MEISHGKKSSKTVFYDQAYVQIKYSIFRCSKTIKHIMEDCQKYNYLMENIIICERSSRVSLMSWILIVMKLKNVIFLMKQGACNFQRVQHHYFRLDIFE